MIREIAINTAYAQCFAVWDSMFSEPRFRVSGFRVWDFRVWGFRV